MQSQEIRQRFLDFMAERGHAIVPSAPLLPENDATTLFVGSGMQPMVPYLLGETHPKGVRIADSQRCFRSEDIEEVGDNRHTTLFEMLGNWSLGDYFKEEQIGWMWEFITDADKGLGLDPNRLYITAHIGDDENGVVKDTEAVAIWTKLFEAAGIDAKAVEIGSEADGGVKGMDGGRIFYYDSKKNWWSRAGVPANMPIGEPGGPDSEMFYDFGTAHDTAWGEHCHPNCDCGRFVEIGNNVFMMYKKVGEGEFEELPNKNIDHGSGFERYVAAVNGDSDIFKTDLFTGCIAVLEKESGKDYSDVEHQASFRVVADHLRAAVFMIADGLVPANKDAGYILRRLLRRAVGKMNRLGFDPNKTQALIEEFITVYKEAYPVVVEQKEKVIGEITRETEKFAQTLEQGLKEFHKIIDLDNDRDNICTQNFGNFDCTSEVNTLSAEEMFKLFTTYGFPLDLIKEEAEKHGVVVDEDGYNLLLAEHQDKSRTASEGKFKGGLAGDSPKMRALHTATHLMLAGLRTHVGDHVHQAGSNTTEERIRFDFANDGKVDRETLDRVEQFVNEAIVAQAVVSIEEMTKEEAKSTGVEGSFWEKYPDTVKVYVVTGPDGTVYSKELCGGPHVENTGEISAFGSFKIKKEESSSAGVRRIKAVLV